jgi:hypothetical protein
VARLWARKYVGVRRCVCVCVCVYVCMSVYTHTHTYICICIHIYIHVYIYIHIYTYIYIYIQMDMAEDTAPLFGSPVVGMAATVGGRLWLTGDYDGRPGRQFELLKDVFSLSLSPTLRATPADESQTSPEWRLHRTRGGPANGISWTIGQVLRRGGAAGGAGGRAQEIVTFTWTSLAADATIDLTVLHLLPLPREMDEDAHTAEAGMGDSLLLEGGDAIAGGGEEAGGEGEGVEAEWRSVQLGGDVPAARQAFSLCVMDEDSLVLFGGLSPGGKGASKYLDDVYVLCVSRALWRRGRGRGKGKGKRGDREREEGALALPPREGGVRVNKSDGKEPSQCEGKGKEPSQCEEAVEKQDERAVWPSARAGHSLTRIGNWAYLYGGLGLKGAKDREGLPAPPIYRMRLVGRGGAGGRGAHADMYGEGEDAGGAGVVWEMPAVSGMVLSDVGLSAHAATAVGSNLIVFGGVTRGGKYSNSMAVLSTCHMIWSRTKL